MYVNAVMFGHRILNLFHNVANVNKINSVKLFVNYYETIINEINGWIFSSIRTPYLSILNFQELKIDLTDKVKIEELRDRYVKLEIRINGIIKSISDNITEEKMSNLILSFLNTIITNNSFIPYQFFTLFELSRINTVDGELRYL
jgi:hypothetical protein